MRTRSRATYSARFRRPWSTPVEIDGSRWHWRVTTRKFRGKGELATESLIGADGIVQIEIIVPNGRMVRKGILFQAKKGWIHHDNVLIKQIRMMEEAAPGGSVVFDYGPEAYRAAPGTSILESDGRPTHDRLRRLGEFLSDDFLECTVGRYDTFYDWNAKSLILAGARPSFYKLYPHFLAAIQVEGAVQSWSGKFL